jgi:hypothetical protein
MKGRPGPRESADLRADLEEDINCLANISKSKRMTERGRLFIGAVRPRSSMSFAENDQAHKGF